jgi:hypothetical protein
MKVMVVNRVLNNPLSAMTINDLPLPLPANGLRVVGHGRWPLNKPGAGGPTRTESETIARTSHRG